MNKPDGFLDIGIDFDHTRLKNYVLNIPSTWWNAEKERGEQFPVHMNTRTIKVKWVPWDECKEEIYEPLYTDISNIASNLLSELTKFYNYGSIFKIILTKLLPASNIPLHVDEGNYLEKTHRIHVPIITNPFVYFKCGEKTINMAEGQVIEINNQQLHHVINLSLQERIHMVVDIVPGTITND
jgi:hypothetical protein